MQNKEHVIRLCLLARLHKKGAAALTRTIGYSTSSLISVLAGRCNMNVSVEKRLGEALGFYPDGFYHSGQVVSWLARNVDDVVQLLEHGFEIEILARFKSDREMSGTKTKRSVLYQLALLRVSFAETERFVVLRMTQHGIDRLLEVPKMNDRVLLDDGGIAQAHYRYLDMPAWSDIDAMPWSAAQQIQHSSLEEKRHTLLGWLTSYIKQLGTETSVRATSGDKFEQQVKSLVTAAYHLRTGLEGRLFGVTYVAQDVPVRVVVLRAGQDFLELTTDVSMEQTVVCAEHIQGLVEILFEGPNHWLNDTVWPKQMSSTQPKKIWAHQLRARNAEVPHDLRLRAR